MKSIKNQIVIDLIMEMNENKKDEEIGKASEQRKERRKGAQGLIVRPLASS